MDASKPLEILKLVFGRDADGRLGVQSASPLTLARADPGDDSFFRVEDGVFVSKPRYASTILSELGHSIVPLVAMVPGERAMRCLGTGFFVSATGLLITAAHVVIDPIERSYGGVRRIGARGWDFSALNLGVMVATNPLFQPQGWTFRNIEWATLLATETDNPLPFGRRDLRLTTDTAICKVEPPLEDQPYQPLSIVQPGIRGVGLDVGKRAFAIGYGAMQDVDLEEVNGSISGDFKFDLHVATGRILERFPDNLTNQQVMTPGPCFSASLRLPPGMSGGPIFDDERIYVHGIVSSGLQDENGPTNLGYGSMLASSMTLPVEQLNGKSMADLLKEGGHGMPQLSIAGA